MCKPRTLGEITNHHEKQGAEWACFDILSVVIFGAKKYDGRMTTSRRNMT